MFNIKNKIHKLTARKEISKCRVRDFLKKYTSKTIWLKGEPFHINEIAGRWDEPDNPYQNRYFIYDKPLSVINPYDIYYRYTGWGDVFIVYRHILIKIDASDRLNIYYSQTCNWNVTDTNVSSDDSENVLYVSMFGDVMEEYVSGKYDEDVYNLLIFFVKNGVFYNK
jgi:hypothetical protein